MLATRLAGIVLVLRELELCLFLESLNWFFFSQRSLNCLGSQGSWSLNLGKYSHDLISKTLTRQSAES